MTDGTMIENRTFDEIKVGDTASISRTLTEEDIQLFALVSGDVNPAHMDADYAATESSLPPERNARILAALRRAHPDARNLEELATRAPAEVMRALLSEVDERHGSAADYLRAHGLAEVELAALRRILIRPEST